MKKIYLTDQFGNKRPRREIQVDEFTYTVSTSGGEATVTLPGSRSYTTDDFMRVYANGLRLDETIEYTRAPTTQITAAVSAMFPDGKFPQNCVLSFEIFRLN